MKKHHERRVAIELHLPKQDRLRPDGSISAAGKHVMAGAAKFERWLASMLPFLGRGRVAVRFEALRLPPGRPNCRALRRRLHALSGR